MRGDSEASVPLHPPPHHLHTILCDVGRTTGSECAGANISVYCFVHAICMTLGDVRLAQLSAAARPETISLSCTLLLSPLHSEDLTAESRDADTALALPIRLQHQFSQ